MLDHRHHRQVARCSSPEGVSFAPTRYHSPRQTARRPRSASIPAGEALAPQRPQRPVTGAFGVYGNWLLRSRGLLPRLTTMTTATKQARPSTVGVRLSPDERAIVQAAAEADMIPMAAVLRRGGLAEAEAIIQRRTNPQ